MYVRIYIYMYKNILNIHVICMYVYIHICICIYIYIYVCTSKRMLYSHMTYNMQQQADFQEIALNVLVLLLCRCEFT